MPGPGLSRGLVARWYLLNLLVSVFSIVGSCQVANRRSDV